MNEFFNYLINLGKFAGFCLVAVIFSQWVKIRVEHNFVEGRAIRISHEGFNSPSVKLDVDHKFPSTTHLYHYHTGRIN